MQCDDFKLKLISPTDYCCKSSHMNEPLVEIYINSKEIVPILIKCELSYQLKDDVKDVGSYGHLIARHFLYSLNEVKIAGSYSNEYGVYLVCCDGCGEPGCASVSTKISEDANYVYWTDFENEHMRDWKYNISYMFEKNKYYKEIKRFEKMLKKCNLQIKKAGLYWKIKM